MARFWIITSMVIACAACGADSFSPVEGCGGNASCGIAAMIYVDACHDRQREIAGVVVGGIRDCDVDFPPLTIGTPAERTIRLTNASRTSLSWSASVDPTSSGDVIFDVVVDSGVIEAGLSAELLVRASALRPGSGGAELHIDSNAANIPPDLPYGVEVDVFATAAHVVDVPPQLPQ